MIEKKIETLLDADEKILWQDQKVMDKLRRYKILFSLIIVLLIMIILLFSIGIFTVLTSDSGITAIIGIIIVGSFFLLPLNIFRSVFKEYRKALNLFDLTPKELKQFKELAVLTDKRWMQRSFYFARFDVLECIKEYVKVEGGIAYIPL